MWSCGSGCPSMYVYTPLHLWFLPMIPNILKSHLFSYLTYFVLPDPHVIITAIILLSTLWLLRSWASLDRTFHNFSATYQQIDEMYVAEERRATDFEAPNLWKGRSGHATVHIQEAEKKTAQSKWREEYFRANKSGFSLCFKIFFICRLLGLTFPRHLMSTSGGWPASISFFRNCKMTKMTRPKSEWVLFLQPSRIVPKMWLGRVGNEK